MKNHIFWIFGILQSASLGLIIYLLFRSLREISSSVSIGLDTQIWLSIAFPMFFLLIQYIIYSKK